MSSPTDTAIDLASYVSGLKVRTALRRRAEIERRKNLRSRLTAVVRCLDERFGVSRVVLFGSLAREDSTLRSDVDLLVEGLSAERYFEAYVSVSELMNDANIDLVPAEVARSAVLRRIEQEGHVLFQRPHG